MRFASFAFLLCTFFLTTTGAEAQDNREKIDLPEMMQDHMLGNMRDHLLALNEIFAALSQGEASEAAKIAENRLGMSSLGLHGAKHLAPYMPEGMQAVGTQMHHVASQLARDIETADVEESFASQQKVFGALEKLTAQCTACHQAYRLR